jgi:SSS family solute:Na+ symporter
LVLSGLISAILSSADSFINSAAVNLTHDIIKPIMAFRHKTMRNELRVCKLTTILAGVLTIIFALQSEDVIAILVSAYVFWAPVVLVPLVAAIFGIKSNIQTLLICAIVGVLTMGLSYYFYEISKQSMVESIVYGFFGNLIVFLILTNLKSENKQIK